MESNLPPHILLIILLGGGVLFVAPRRWVLPTILALTVFVSTQFNVFIFGLNFFPARILLLFAWARVLARGEHHGLQLLPMDRAFIWFCGSMVLVETLRRGWPGLVYSAANSLYDSLGIYFLARVFLSEGKDIKQLIAVMAVICSVLAGFMLAERVTRHNFLTFLGAAMEQVQTRDGKMRCQATFAHPVLAGSYGAVLLPLFVAFWWQSRRMRIFGAIGTIAATLTAVTSGSGGPIMTYAAGVMGLFIWPLRRQMRLLRWGILLGLVSLHIVMQAPVWALIARASSLTGGSGWHRFNLIDSFINHIGDWWLLGVESTEQWGRLTDDVANTFCIIAKHGGLLALVLFVRFLAAGFREVGIAQKLAETGWPTGILVWAIGACLFGHVVTFFGTNYFDQTAVLWYLTLAMLASLHLLTKAQPQPEISAWREEAKIPETAEPSRGIAWN